MFWFPFNIPIIPQCIILFMTLFTTTYALMPKIASKRWFTLCNQLNFVLIVFWCLHYLWLLHDGS